MANVLLTRSCNTRQRHCSNKNAKIYLEAVMDAKWNNVMDNIAVRIGMLVVGFGAWLAIGYGLMSL